MSVNNSIFIPPRSSRGLTRSAQSGPRSLASCDKSTTTNTPTPPVQLRKRIRAGSWNVRTLFATGAARILVEELHKARVNLMGLQEVRWHGAGEVKMLDYTILWSGSPEGSARQSGVGLAVDKRTSSALLSWQPVSERLFIAKFSHTFGILAVFVAYAPTNTSPDSDKDSFYAELDYHIQNLKPSDVVLGLGDFNAETGTTRVNLERVLGPHGSGTRNDNSECLLNFCSDKGLRVAGSWFQRRSIHRLTWFSNNGTTTKEIDHVLISSRWTILENCRVYRSLEFDTDHRPVISETSTQTEAEGQHNSYAKPTL